MRTNRETTKPPAVRNSRPARCHRDTELRLPRDDKSLDSRLDVAPPETQRASSTSESYQTVSGGEPEDTRDHGDGGDTGLSVNTGVSGEGKGDAGEATSSSNQFACDTARDDQQMHYQRPNALGARATVGPAGTKTREETTVKAQRGQCTTPISPQTVMTSQNFAPRTSIPPRTAASQSPVFSTPPRTAATSS